MTAEDRLIRPAAPADLEAVAGIYAHYVRHTVSTFEETAPPVEHWQQRLDDLAARGLPFLVAEVSGRIVGYAYAGPWRPKPAYRHTAEHSVYLDPRHTARGHGTALLEALVAACARTDLRQLVAVIASPGNDASVALHRRLGFTEAGRLAAVGHKHGRWIDTLLMQLTLVPTPTTPADSTAPVTPADPAVPGAGPTPSR
ncbi:N-acetyltransferase family protein [Kitasatospora sp. NA04385]|uniref:GNAT family N-acetyltransferase n=1 Tax=Kitasatospora sp. NA04385 TaxID=2742135 RepID=UPI0015924AD5|nr:GNAT family N-acetyltransferase [Kitasatospora sp. NA04385]QKW22868.1 N-acetyltransferase family protein [Kitasatospora sp. NA04385]